MTSTSDAPIFLIGYRGTGKTSVARELAARIEYDWADTDDEIERQAGTSIAAIFADDGEATFRDAEESVVAQMANRRRTVIAMGGGALVRELNRRAITAAGPVVWLTASVNTILQRMAGDPKTPGRRPKLTTASERAEVEAVLADRAPIYRQCATLVVDTEGKSPAQVAEEIVASL
jgi:shikimate kinase